MRFIILNFYESPENYHLEKTLISYIETLKHNAITIHNYKNDYSKLSKKPIKFRVYFNYFNLKTLNKYDFIISIDFPWKRDKSYLFYLKLIKNSNIKKIIIANHLCPNPKDSAFIEDSLKYDLMKLFKTIYILEYDDKRLWPKGTKIIKREFAIDTQYYKPIKTQKKFDIVCFGSKSREINWLEDFKDKYSIAILTSLPNKNSNRIKYFDIKTNLFKIREIISKSRIMAIPIKEDEKNPACGNTAAFISLACGIPPLVRDTYYFRKYIRDDENGYLYKNEKNFKEKLVKILSNNKKDIEINILRKTAVKHASLNNLVKKILSKEVK